MSRPMLLFLGAFLAAVSLRAETAKISEAAFYDRLYGDGRLDITVALGFDQIHPADDTNRAIEPVVEFFDSFHRDDQHERQLITSIHDALMSCDVCGFKVTEDGPITRVYSSEIRRPSTGQPIQVTLHFIAAAPGTNPRAVRDAFKEALARDEVIYYAGHSREGTGFPDFGPPVLSEGKVFVRKTFRNTFTNMDKGLFAKDRYQILMLNSCESKKYYLQALRHSLKGKDASDLGLILTTDPSFFEDDPPAIVTLIRGLMLEHSRETIMAELESASKTYAAELKEQNRPFKPLYYGDGFLDRPSNQ